MEEKDLVKYAKQGDRQAFGELYEWYRVRLFRYAYFKLGSVDDAEDAVEECVIEAFEGLDSLRNEGAFSGWIFKILYRKCCALQKEQIRLRGQADIDSLTNYEIDTYSFNYDTAELAEALKLLSSEERDIVLLSVLGGYSSKEVGKLMKLKSSTVRSKLSRGLKKMRESLE